jgi:hypothetical protein
VDRAAAELEPFAGALGQRPGRIGHAGQRIAASIRLPNVVFAGDTGARMELDLDGRVVLVTGGSRGIGYAVVAICSRDEATSSGASRAWARTGLSWARKPGLTRTGSAVARPGADRRRDGHR